MQYPQAIVAIVIGFIFILVGVPIWWNTTKVYRASLPHDEIIDLYSSSINLKARVNIKSTFHSKAEQTDILTLLANKGNTIKFSIDKETSIESTKLSDASSYCIKHNHSILLTFEFIILKDPTLDKRALFLCPESLTGIISLPIDSNVNDTVHALDDVLNEILPYSTLSDLSSGVLKKKNSMPLAPGYQLTFTLAVANPIDYLPTWDIQEAITKYLEPVLEEFDFLGPFKIASQVLYYVDVGINPHRDNQTFYYTQAKLPLLINPIESRLATHISTNPSLNFIVYVPPKKYTPLFIRKNKADYTSTRTSFHSPRWGGFIFLNPVSSDNVTVNSDVMDIFVEQFQTLIGAVSISSSFQRYNLLILKTFDHLRTSIGTLRSLSTLLDEIANIVIKDEIKVLVEDSLRNIEKANASLNSGNLVDAFEASKKAFLSSEKAFFDSSLLALLYFPDDQKYAIYVPLFLPISIPVITSFFRAIKWLKSTDSSKLKSE